MGGAVDGVDGVDGTTRSIKKRCAFRTCATGGMQKSTSDTIAREEGAYVG